MGRLIQLEGDAGSVKVLDTITFEASTDDTGNGSTSVTYRSEFQPMGAAKVVEPLLLRY